MVLPLIDAAIDRHHEEAVADGDIGCDRGGARATPLNGIETELQVMETAALNARVAATRS